MRPIDRGPTPLDDSGQPIQFTNYQDAREPLIQRIGEYCSYCEMHRPDGPDIEHVQPKSNNPALEKEWNNFLLGCRNCNSIKGNTPIQIGDYFWPDVHNTFLLLKYLVDLPPQPSENLSSDQVNKVLAIIQLTGLDRLPGHPKYSPKDRRWLKRHEAWSTAQQSLENLHKNDTEFMRQQIILTAKECGFWSVWMIVFHDDPDMRCRLIDVFPGTARNCFDKQGNPVPRPVES